jgi:hypothetical protein
VIQLHSHISETSDSRGRVAQSSPHLYTVSSFRLRVIWLVLFRFCLDVPYCHPESFVPFPTADHVVRTYKLQHEVLITLVIACISSLFHANEVLQLPLSFRTNP